jgi:carbonic anhydrase
MELHLVHRGQGGLAVVGVFLVEGAENPALAPVFDNLPAEEGEPQEVAGASVNAAELLPLLAL